MFTPILLLAASLLPCRYTVRDVAFVDLQDPSYRLVTYVAEEDGARLGEDLSRLATAILDGSNVEGCVLDPDGPLEGEDASRLSLHQVQDSPFTALISPSGRELVLPWEGTGQEASASASRLFNSVVHSPARERIADSLIECYCVVVLVEGRREAENQAAAAALEEAFEKLAEIFDSMPKAVGEAPRTVRISPTDHELERVLLWSLGLEDPGAEGPAIAVLFGRGRQVGPVLTGDALNVDGLFRILAVVGEDCECDLDRLWMRGPRIPLRWDSSMSQRATSLLGFDPDSPGVCTEISTILGRHASETRSSPALAPIFDEMVLAYREESVEPGETPSLTTPTPRGGPGPRENSGEADDTALKSLLIAFSAIAGLSVLCSVAVLIRTRPR